MSWFLFIRPRRRMMARQRELLGALSSGDQVVTVGGMYGTIVGLDGDEVRLEIAPDVVIRVARRAIAGRVGAAAGSARRGTRRGVRRAPIKAFANRRDLGARTTSMSGRVTDRTKNHLILLAMLVLLALTGARGVS